MNDKTLPKNNNLLPNARKLRKEMTRQERHLWYDFLRPYPVKIYKQRIIGNYIVDFYCASAKIVIELDGSQHFTNDGIECDKARDEFLQACGLDVIRIPNNDIDYRFNSVCEMLHNKIQCSINRI